MRNKPMEPLPAVDRPATWEEVSRAEVASPEHIIEVFASHRGYCESDCDLGGKIGFPAALFEFCCTMSEPEPTEIN